MAKKKASNVDISVDTEKVDVSINKKGKNVKVKVDTPKVDVHLSKDEEVKEFKLDTEKLDVEVKKDETGTVVVVESKNSFLKRFGNWISKAFVKKFNK
jgi:hypothetical protein